MKKRARYSIGGYEGDQIGPIVQAILNDADAEPDGRVALKELVEALYRHVTVWDRPIDEADRRVAALAAQPKDPEDPQ